MHLTADNAGRCLLGDVPIRHVTHETRSLIPDEQRAKFDRARWLCTTRPKSEPANGTAPPNLGSPHCGIYWQLRGEYTRCTARGSDIARPRLAVGQVPLYTSYVNFGILMRYPFCCPSI